MSCWCNGEENKGEVRFEHDYKAQRRRGAPAEGGPQGRRNDAGTSRRVGGHEEIQHIPSGKWQIQSESGFSGEGGRWPGETDHREGDLARSPSSMD